DALEVDLERMVPLLIVEPGQRDAVGDAGIGDDRVDPAVLLLSRGDDGVGGLCRADVELVELGLPASACDLVGDARAFLFQDVRRHDRISSLCESLGGGAADADARPGDEDSLAHSITSPELGPMVWPTNRLACSEQRKATAAATSSGSPNRPSGSS